MLRALGKAAYINGSHFAIMWVTASGQAETYASEAFQGRLEDWFDQSGIKSEGKQLVLERGGAASNAPLDLGDTPGIFSDDEDFETKDDSLEGPDEPLPASRRASMKTSGVQTPLITCNDVFSSASAAVDEPAQSLSLTRPSPGVQDSSRTPSLGLSASRPNRKPLAPLDTNCVNSTYATVSKNTLLQPFPSAVDENLFRAPLSAPLPSERCNKRAPISRVPSSSTLSANLFDVLLADGDARTAFFELRFAQMQQGMCKTIAKAWIKIIEPKKQTRCPYNKGEEGKPEWWPDGVRHKEPDHLMKPERHSLLLTILRSPKVKVARLQLATAEVVAMIKADKVNLLMDVYRIAREEERLRENGRGSTDNIPINIGVSTLDGWKVGGDGEKGGLDEEGKRFTTAADTPDMDEKKGKKNVKKRSNLSAAMVRSASTSASASAAAAAAGSKRQRMSLADEASGHVINSEASQPMQKSASASGLGIGARSAGPSRLGLSASSHYAEECRNIPTVMRPRSSEDLSQPLSYPQQTQPTPSFFPTSSSASPLFDQPSFESSQSFQPSRPIGAPMQPGTMSAPHGGQPHLYPVHFHASNLPVSADHSPAMPQYGFAYNPAFLNPFEPSAANQTRMQGNQTGSYHQPNVQDSPAGANGLGLQGLADSSLPWASPFEESPMTFESMDNSAWNTAPAHQPSSLHEHLMRSHMASEMDSAGGTPGRMVSLPTGGNGSGDDSFGDLSLDRSFVSATTEGPATPSQAHGQSLAAAMPHNDMSKLLQQGQQSTAEGYSALAAGMYQGHRPTHPTSYDPWA